MPLLYLDATFFYYLSDYLFLDDDYPFSGSLSPKTAYWNYPENSTVFFLEVFSTYFSLLQIFVTNIASLFFVVKFCHAV